MEQKKRLGEILIERKAISTAQLEEALKKQKEFSLPLGETLIQLKFISEQILLETLSRQLNIEFINIAEGDYQIIDRSLVNVLPLEVCKRLRILPIFQIVDIETKELTLAMCDPLNDNAIKEVEQLTECHVSPILSTAASIAGGIAKMFNVKAEAAAESLTFEKGDIVTMVNKMLLKAVQLGASDIHIEPHAKETHVRMRIDGVLQVISAIPSAHHPSIVSRIKIMGSEQNSNMKIEERRLPQDGGFSRVISGRAVDGRISTLPMLYGEKVVIRVLDKDKSGYIGRVAHLKMPPSIELAFRRCIRQPSGIIIISGPTGSGKTTTLNAVVNEINNPGINIVTVEDPVEHHSPDYVNQSSLMPYAGYTYARALRAILRQDPNVILIGEVRDLETAEIAVQAALTGHRVFTTLHTEDAAGAVVRMVDIGIEQFLVSATLVSVVNQRLLRKVCTNCMEEYVPTELEMLDVGIDKYVVAEIMDNVGRFTFRRGKGCSDCRQTGYRGRQGVYEMITVTPEIRNLILKKQNSDVIAEESRQTSKTNMLFEEGLRSVLTGVTTLGEMQRIPRGDYKVKTVERIFQDSQVDQIF